MCAETRQRVVDVVSLLILRQYQKKLGIALIHEIIPNENVRIVGVGSSKNAACATRIPNTVRFVLASMDVGRQEVRHFPTCLFLLRHVS